MDSKFKTMLRRWQNNKSLVEFDRRPRIRERITGFVLDFSDSLILLHLLEWNTFSLNGYIIIREGDINRYRLFDKQTHWQNKAAKKNKLVPLRPIISLKSLEDAISSANKIFPLIAIEKELASDDKRWIGKLTGFTSKTVTIHGLDPSAEWIENSRFNLKEITRIEFGGGYENALALSAKKIGKN